MLRELSVEGFALVDSLRLELPPGFTVLTGETGAGKSIIIDALGAALGERVGAEAIREGEPAARVEAVFDGADAPRALEALQALGLGETGDSTIILSREIASGRSTYRINRRVVTLGAVQEVSRHLVDIHGQHEHQALVHETNHLSFLDTFGGPEHLLLKDQFEKEYDALQEVQAALRGLEVDERERAQRADLLAFQVGEITEAGLSPGEDEALAAERLQLQELDKLQAAILAAREFLDGETAKGDSAVSALEMACRQLRSVAHLDATLAATLSEIEAASVAVSEAARTLGEYLGKLEPDPQRLEQIEDRLAEIARLRRKYGDTIEEILAFRDRAAAELAQLGSLEERRMALQAELSQRRQAAGRAAEKLSASRKALAGRLEEAVGKQLAGLGMEAAVLKVALERDVDEQEGVIGADGISYRATRRGIDICQFLFSANPGEPVRPLSRIASGGELSRLMLVFKTLCSRSAEVPTIVFDEVDAGIGGRVAHAVGERLAALAARGQVLCVTHLPQIARFADNHIAVRKEIRNGRTVVEADRLTKAERVRELARMLGGAAGDAIALKHAEELLAEVAQRRGARGAGVGAT